MPYAENCGVQIYWEEEGSGEPLLMIMGLGFSLAMWRDLRPVMARHFRTILFDNRGVGKSGVPLRPWSLPAMARDAVCVLDAAGVRSAHVLGVSMGGMIAQELAIVHPERVRKLVLGCTWCGRRRAVRPAPEVRRALLGQLFRRRRDRIRAIIPFLYDPHTPRERIDSDIAVVVRHQPAMRGQLAQVAAIVAWTCWDRLPSIVAPTLVIHGETDRLVPPENSRILAERITGAKLVMLPRASHIFPTDQPELTREAILEFLLGAESVDVLSGRT